MHKCGIQYNGQCSPNQEVGVDWCQFNDKKEICEYKTEYKHLKPFFTKEIQDILYKKYNNDTLDSIDVYRVIDEIKDNTQLHDKFKKLTKKEKESVLLTYKHFVIEEESMKIITSLDNKEIEYDTSGKITSLVQKIMNTMSLSNSQSSHQDASTQMTHKAMEVISFVTHNLSKDKEFRFLYRHIRTYFDKDSSMQRLIHFLIQNIRSPQNKYYIDTNLVPLSFSCKHCKENINFKYTNEKWFLNSPKASKAVENFKRKIKSHYKTKHNQTLDTTKEFKNMLQVINTYLYSSDFVSYFPYELRDSEQQNVRCLNVGYFVYDSSVDPWSELPKYIIDDLKQKFKSSPDMDVTEPTKLGQITQSLYKKCIKDVILSNSMSSFQLKETSFAKLLVKTWNKLFPSIQIQQFYILQELVDVLYETDKSHVSPKWITSQIKVIRDQHDVHKKKLIGRKKVCKPITTERKRIVPTLIESYEDKENRLDEKKEVNSQQRIREILSLLKRQTDGDTKELVIELESLLS